MIKETDEKKSRNLEDGVENDQNKAEGDRRTKAVKERETQRIWDFCVGKSNQDSDSG